MTDDYGAAIGASLTGDIISTYGSEAMTGDKARAIYALIQRGIDIYAAWQNGATWRLGAGQGFGRKPALVYFGGLITDINVHQNIQSIHDDKIFIEDRQVGFGQDGVTPLWVGDPASSPFAYWSYVTNAQCYAGAPGPCNLSSQNRASGDYYGFIDGAAEKPQDGYASCCSNAQHIAFSATYRAMGNMCVVNNADVHRRYVDRITAQGISSAVVLAGSDPCAPPDPREPSQCLKNGNCSYYGKTWGHSNGTNSCITNAEARAAGHPGNPNGRFPQLNGTKSPGLGYSTAIVNELWSALNSDSCVASTNDRPQAPFLMAD
ncbi:MAG: hypothetical protein AB7O54_08405 [Pseudomonadales bacterium]